MKGTGVKNGVAIDIRGKTVTLSASKAHIQERLDP